MVKRVVVKVDGEIVLELRAPFAYLKDLSDRARREREGIPEMQTSSQYAGCSDWLQTSSTRWIREEHLNEDQVAAFFLSITFPQRDQLTRFMTTVS
jgi:hypothetical protein